MNDKKFIEIRLLTIPYVTLTSKDFNLTNIGMHTSYKVKEGTVLFVGKAIRNQCHSRTGYLVFNGIKDIYVFWPGSNNNIHEYLRMVGKSTKWREDIVLLQDKKEEFIIEIGPKC